MDKFCDKEVAKVMDKLGDMLKSTPRALQHECHVAKYDNWAGGGDSSRFRKQAWNAGSDRPGSACGNPRPSSSGRPGSSLGTARPPTRGGGGQRPKSGGATTSRRPRQDMGPQRPDMVPTFEFKDPGFDIRPGFLCDPQSRKTSVAHGFTALTPRPKSVDPAAGKAPLTARQ
mmetsp:Transcript_50864/g.129180  ORF Transcript_50864/g.129180 Transcript_50864/m.129180 type:complete len:172 (+) Transcript_50864:143-658(+)